LIYLLKKFIIRIIYKYFFPKTTFEETFVGLQLVKNFHKIESITASIKYKEGEIFFNPIRLNFSELLAIINKIDIKDNFLFD